MSSARLAITTLIFLVAPASFHAINYDDSVDERAAPDVNTVVFELFTRADPLRATILKLDDLEALQLSDFNPKLPTKMYAHGWTGSPEKSYNIRDEYLRREDCNFIAVDWSVLASGIEYPIIVKRDLPRAAQRTGEFIDFLVGNTGASFSSIHLIGHSLGAHVVGGAGATVTLGRIPRITGLDPAGPWFPINETDTRLDVTDADFVDIIHTDSGDLTGNELGMQEAIGHIDFYPNGGAIQPGCRGNIINDTRLADQARDNCDHERSRTYFCESINSPIGFRAVECESYEDFLDGLCNDNNAVLMGEPTPVLARGIFYLNTKDTSPFALG